MSPCTTCAKCGPNLFAHNENSAYIMPCVTAHAVTSCTHHMAHAHRQPATPMKMWCTRNNLQVVDFKRPVGTEILQLQL